MLNPNISQKDVSVLIVSWNSSNFIFNCLQSVYQFTQGFSFEVIVIDNGSNDKTVEIIHMNFPDVRVVETGMNLGFSPAINIAILMARGRYLFLLNPDTRFESNVIGELAIFLQTHHDAGAVSPKILEEDGSINLFAARQFPSISNTIFLQFGLRKFFPRNRVFGKETLAGWDHNSVRSVPCLNGAALMIPHSVINQVGLFDEQLPMYFEDIDFCARIRSLGKNLYYIPDAVLRHLREKSANLFQDRLILFAMENGQAPWLYFRKYRGSLFALIFTLVVFLGSLFRILMLLFFFPVAMLKRGDFKMPIPMLLKKSLALLQWSLFRKRDFKKRLSEIFADIKISALKVV